MANIQTVVKVELDPGHPVPEVLSVIRAVIPFHPGRERTILLGIMEAIEQRMISLDKGAEKHGEPVGEHRRVEADSGELG